MSMYYGFIQHVGNKDEVSLFTIEQAKKALKEKGLDPEALPDYEKLSKSRVISYTGFIEGFPLSGYPSIVQLLETDKAAEGFLKQKAIGKKEFSLSDLAQYIWNIDVWQGCTLSFLEENDLNAKDLEQESMSWIYNTIEGISECMHIRFEDFTKEPYKDLYIDDVGIVKDIRELLNEVNSLDFTEKEKIHVGPDLEKGADKSLLSMDITKTDDGYKWALKLQPYSYDEIFDVSNSEMMNQNNAGKFINSLIDDIIKEKDSAEEEKDL